MSDDAVTLQGRPSANTLARASAGDLGFGTRIGRYLVLDVLGRGGMGVVYAAYDPVLDRKIAVKLLADLVDDDASQGRVRMQREAQALARLAHPNVITVHDVAEHGGAMYIAMEIVEGSTLRDWRGSRSWRDVLAGYLAAARGLAAAHAAGLVHRDFKPDNVLVGNDGRIRVTDFGLARLVDQVSAPLRAAARPGGAGACEDLAPPARPSVSPISSPLAERLTAEGALMGTPSYMAPEQIDGGTVDARSDQFAWCVAAWEALYNVQPFPGGNLALRSAAIKADPAVPPARSPVPRDVGRALARGLAAEPAQRWSDITALVDALERAMRPRRGPVVAVGAGALAVGALAVVFVLGRTSSTAAAPSCDAAGDAIDATWTADARAAIGSGFVATGASFARDAAAALDRAVDRWRERWRRTAVDSCRATRETGAQSEAMLDLRTTCLARRRGELANLLAGLAHPARDVVEQAPTLRLPDLDTCDDAAQLAGAEPRPRDAAAAAAVARVEATLDRLEAASAGGLAIDGARADVGFATVAAIDAAATGWHPLVARAWREVAALERELGDGKRARATLLDAVAAATAAGDLDDVTDLELALADVEARLTSDFERGDGWVALAGGTLARLGGRTDKQRALARARGLLAYRAGHMTAAEVAYRAEVALAHASPDRASEASALGDLALAEGERDELADARDHLATAIAMAEQAYGANHPKTATLLHASGVVAYREGRYQASLDAFHRALAIRAAAFGTDSVEYAQTLESIGVSELALDRVDASTEHVEHALALLVARLGPDHPDVANAYNDAGGAYHRAGLYARALATARFTLAARERTLGPDHPDVGESLVNLAIESKALKQWDVVEPSYTRALAIFDKAYGEHNTYTAITHLNFAEALRVEGKLDAAAAQYAIARDTLVALLGADHPVLGHVWNGLGQLALARGDLPTARAQLAHAIAIRERDAGDKTALAETRFALARALPSDDPRATPLATQARDAYRDAGKAFAAQAAEIDGWLAARRH